MISKKMSKAINDQMTREMYSGYLYMSMSSFCASKGLKGFANWLMVQYHEEMFHGMKMYEYLQSQGENVKIGQIDEPPSEWDSVLELFEKVLEHEQKVTKWINELMDLAIKENDHATRIFMQWYVTEQIEEEENDHEIIDRLKLTGDNSQAMIMFDRELGGRIANVPTDFSKGVQAAAKAMGE